MFTVTESISIDRAAGEVFDFLTDGRNRPKWDTSVISEELTSPPPVSVGSTIHSRMRAVGREVDFDWEVTQFDRPTRMAVTSTEGLMPTSLTLDFVAAESTAGTACEVTATITGSPEGMMRFIEPMIAESVRSTLATGLGRAKGLLEAHA